MQIPPQLESISSDIALDSAMLHRITEDGRITEEEMPALMEVRDDLREQLIALERLIAYQQLAIWMFQHAQQPNRHIKRRWQVIEEAAQTEHSSQAA